MKIVVVVPVVRRLRLSVHEASGPKGPIHALLFVRPEGRTSSVPGANRGSIESTILSKDSSLTRRSLTAISAYATSRHYAKTLSHLHSGKRSSRCPEPGADETPGAVFRPSRPGRSRQLTGRGPDGRCRRQRPAR